MARHLLAAVVVVSLSSSCGPGGASKAGVARAALTVKANEVSCSTPAPRAFSTALCVCKDLRLTGSGVSVASSDDLASNVGVNGHTSATGDWEVQGGLLSWQGVGGTGTLTVRDDVATTGDVSGTGTLSVGKDLVVGGDLTAVGKLSVGGAVRVQGRFSQTTTSATPVRLGPYVAPAGPPCGCDPAQLIDVPALVAQAKAQNQNAGLGVATHLSSTGSLALELTGGRVYLDGLSSVGSLRLHVSAPTALFIDGDYETVGDDEISVDEGASLDLYVNGRLENVGHWKVSSSTLAGTVRLFVGGQGSMVQSVGSQDFVGSLYAPTADVNLTGDMSVRGALFARSLTGTGRLHVDFATAAVPAAGSCPAP